MKTFARFLCSALSVASLSLVSSQAAPIDPGNLLIYRVGDGSGALAATATAVFIDEYTPLGTLVQSIAVPAADAAALTAVGTSSTEGIMSVAMNGTAQAKVIFTGYRANVGAAVPGSVAKVIGVVGLNGVVDSSSFAITDAGTAVIRSAASTDGSSLFYVGTSTGVRYVGSPGPAATSTVIDTRNSRQVVLTGNQLRASNGSTSTTSKVQDYGTLPIGTTVPTPIVTLGSSDAVNGISFFDLNPMIAGVDTVYALSTVAGQLVKWTYDGSIWSANGSISASGCQNLTGYADGNGVHLYLTSPTTLYSEFDASGYGANITGSLTSITTAGNNTAFRGISVIPEPSTISLGLIGLASLMVIRRRRS